MKISHCISLVFYTIIIICTGYLLNASGITIPFTDLTILSAVFAIIAGLVLFIFFRGQKMEPASQTMHSLVAMSVKLLLEMLFALIWFILAKKTSVQLVLLFFVLYLAFTLYSVLFILKTLRNKSIDNKISLENV